MALTQEYKNEVERILKAWKDVVASQWGKTWNEVRDYLLNNYKKVLDDPFLASFKTSRTLEETAWLFKRLQQFYGDEKDGIFTQIKSTMNMDIPHGYLYNTHLLKNQVIANLNERTDTLIKEQETAKSELTKANEAKTAAETAKTKAEGERDAAKVAQTRAEGERDQANREKATAQTERDNANTAKAAAETAKAVAETERDAANTAKTQAETERDNAKADATKAKGDLSKWETAFPTSKYPNGPADIINQQSQQTGDSNKALKKLIEIYTTEIKKQTELFYQKLNLDNNWINEKYGNKEVSYLDRLKNLTADSEPEQVINAFRIVALIKATEKAQEAHDEYKDKLSTLTKPFKKLNLKKFNNIKDTWELITSEPAEANNPLYLADIKQKNSYITQINNIITLWL